MRNYIVIAFLSILILGKLIGIINILIGKYKSFFVSYFTIAPIDSHQISALSQKKKNRFNFLAILSAIIDILISIIVILVISKVETEVILLLALILYVNSTLFTKYSNKVLQR
jgi:hypothetical protein